MTFQLSAHGANVSYANGCVTEQFQGRVTHECRSLNPATRSPPCAYIKLTRWPRPTSSRVAWNTLLSTPPSDRARWRLVTIIK
jgi:hypothetical protein